MIFTVSPIQSLVFLVFIVILQQLEGNLIYPKVVGASIGLPGIWVLAAVTIGGGLGGIPGMLIGVPLAATVYRLICMDVQERTGNENISADSKEAEEMCIRDSIITLQRQQVNSLIKENDNKRRFFNDITG